MCLSRKEEEGVPKIDRNRRHRENTKQISASDARGENEPEAFLYVPIPAVLSDPLSSSSLTLNS
jgi:hypothetical protein